MVRWLVLVWSGCCGGWGDGWFAWLAVGWWIGDNESYIQEATRYVNLYKEIFTYKHTHTHNLRTHIMQIHILPNTN